MVKFTKKDRLLFWNAVLVGIIGGIIGNLWVGYLLSIYENPYDLARWLGAIIFSLILLGLLTFISRQIHNIK